MQILSKFRSTISIALIFSTMSECSEMKVSPSPLPPNALKRSQSDSNSSSSSSGNQISVHSIGSDIVVNSDATHPDGRSKIQKMGPIHPQCLSIGGIYNLKTTDVMLLCSSVADDVLVPSHKSILAADSTVFYRQFYVESCAINTFRIANTTADMLCKFLTSFYGKSMQVHRADLPELMQLAYDFDAGKCKEICNEFLQKSLDAGIDDVLWVLGMALTHNCPAIRDRCIESIHQYGDFLIETDAFLSCNRQVFKLILSDNFIGRNEKKLFAACVEWAKRRIGATKTVTSYEEIRREIGKSFEMIHFNRMSAEQFVECLSEFTMIFNTEEIQEMSKTISGHRESERASNGDLNGMAVQQKVIPRGKLMTMRYIFANHVADFRKLYNDNVSADMHFVFEANDVRIAAHKCILATRSSIFEKRLFEVNGPVQVVVKSASPRLFSAFLKTLYGYGIDEVTQKTNLDAILSLAYEYNVLDIGKGQENQLKEFVTLETLFWAVNLCRKFGFVDSMNFNCKWIKKNANKFDLNLAFHPTALVHCSRTIVQNALDIDYNDRDATRVFQAVINWAKHRCQRSKSNPTITITNLRRKLKGVLPLIPFHQMTRPQFDACQQIYPGLLNEMEIQNVLAKMTVGSNSVGRIDDSSQ